MANIPVDNDMGVALPVEETAGEISPEQRALAKLGNSADWEIIINYLNQRIDVYRKGLFGEDLAGKDTSIIGQRFLAAQTVVNEFESLIAEVETTTKSVKDASSKE